MRSKIPTGAAIALTAAALMTAGPASAQSRQGNRSNVVAGAAGIAAGVVGGALATATSPFRGLGHYGYYPGYAYAPGYNYAAPYGYYGGYPGYAYSPGYSSAPLYGYYGSYEESPWNYRGGPHPR